MMLLSCQTLKGNRSGGGFLSHEGTKGTKVFLGGIARVYLTTEYTEHTERRSSAVSREGAKARRLEGECPHEPPSTVRKDGFRVCCGALGGASVCLPADEQTLVPPQRRSRRHPVKKSLRLRVSALKNRRSVGTKCCSAFSPLHKPFIRLAERREGRALLVRAAFYAAITGKMPVPHSPVPVLCNKGTGV